MSYLTYRFTAEPTTQQYAALRAARWQTKNYRNACLEERVGSYAAAKAAALRAGRDRPTQADWIAARRAACRCVPGMAVRAGRPFPYGA